MTAAIITIGDELMIGQVVDTNSARIAAMLNGAGIVVESKFTVGDLEDRMTQAIDDSLKHHDIVITTGGIGPTRDDKTKQVVAALFDCPLVRHRPTYDHVERMIAVRGFVFNDLNKAQADVPSCATVIHNEHGTAPALWLERDGHILIVLPGVPFETEALMSSRIMPRLRERFPDGGIVHRTMITTGIGESVLAEKIAGWEDSLPGYISLAYLPSPSGVRLRLSAYDVDAEAVGRQIDEFFAELETIIPGNVMGYGEQSIESFVAHLLVERGVTLATAESCTGGAIAARLTASAGASEYFRGGVVAYDNSVKVGVLGVREEDIAAHGAVSGAVAEQMAEGVRRVTGSDYGIATTGIAGPTGGSAEKPVGTVWIAVGGPKGTISRMYRFGAIRSVNIERASAAALNLLREALA